MKKRTSNFSGMEFLVALFGVFLITGHSAHAALISYDITFYKTDFTEISAYSGGFTYDDGTQFVSDFKLDLDMFGQLDLGLSVPAAALYLGAPPATAFSSVLFAALSGGDADLCVLGCNAVFTDSNVFAVLDTTFNTVDAKTLPLSSFGYYQILPSEVPEPSALLLMLLGGIVLYSKKHLVQSKI